MPHPNTKKKISKIWRFSDNPTDCNPSRKLERPGAPHNTTQYLIKNLVYNINTMQEEDITEITGTMAGIYVCTDM